jgi:hypothetical protein
MGSKKRVMIRKYTALTEGGVRNEYEKDANRLAQMGYRPTASVDHGRGRWAGVQMMVTYELVDTPQWPAASQPMPKQVSQWPAASQPMPQQAARCAAVSPDRWQCTLASGHEGPHSTIAV